MQPVEETKDNTVARLAERMKNIEVTSAERKKKQKKADHKRVWFDAEDAYAECVGHLSIAGQISSILRHPELKEKVSPEKQGEIATLAKAMAENTRDSIAVLKELRARHTETANKYPIRQKARRGTTEMMDVMGIMEGYLTWTEDAIQKLSVPGLEILALISEAGLNIEQNEELPAPSPSVKEDSNNKTVRKRPAKRVKQKHLRPKKK